MTLEERAQRIGKAVREYGESMSAPFPPRTEPGRGYAEFVGAVLRELQEAVAEEREACLRLADEDEMRPARSIASAIRARGDGA